MAPLVPVGSIFFRESVILVPQSPREEHALEKGGILPSRLPQIRSARSTPGPCKTPMSSCSRLPSSRQGSCSSRASEHVVLPDVAQVLDSVLPSEPTPAIPESLVPRPPTKPKRRWKNAQVLDGILPSEPTPAGPETLVPRPPTKPKGRRKNPRRKNLLRTAVTSDKTIAEVTRIKDTAGGGAVCRYDVLELELRKATANRSKLARHRLDITKHEADAQRERVRKRANRKKQLSKKEDVVAEMVDAEARENRDSFQLPSRRSSMMVRGSVEETGEGPSLILPDKDSSRRSLLHVKLSHDKESRMEWVNRARSMSRHRQSQLHISQARTIDFEMLPEKEQADLKTAFKLFFKEEEASKNVFSSAPRRTVLASLARYNSLSAMDAEGASSRLFPCLAELGLHGKNDFEQKEIHVLCQEYEMNHALDLDFNKFCFEVVPKARGKLMEIHQEAMNEQFAYYDQDSSGFLDYEECYDMFKLLCRNMNSSARAEVEQEFIERFEQLKFVDEQCGEHVDFDGFQTLLERVREKCNFVRMEHTEMILETRGVSAEQALDYADELLILHETFSDQDADGNGVLDASEVLSALFEHGLMPYAIKERQRVELQVENALKKAAICGKDGVGFASFLRLIRQVREENLHQETDNLEEYFDMCDKDGNGLLTFAEASQIFPKLGLIPVCREDQDEMKNLLLKVDVDKSNSLDLEEFQSLVQHITEKLRSNQRHRESEVAKRLGFSVHQVAELREIFFRLDTHGTGKITITECRKTLTLLRIEMSAPDLKALFDSIDKHQHGRPEAVMELEGFLFFIRDIAEHSTHKTGNPLAPTQKVHPRNSIQDIEERWAEWDDSGVQQKKARARGFLASKQTIAQFT